MVNKSVIRTTRYSRSRTTATSVEPHQLHIMREVPRDGSVISDDSGRWTRRDNVESSWSVFDPAVYVFIVFGCKTL